MGLLQFASTVATTAIFALCAIVRMFPALNLAAC